MKLAIKTCTLDMPYEQMLDFCVEQKIAAIEIGTGNWSGAPHCDLDLLVSDKTARENGTMPCVRRVWSCARSTARATRSRMKRTWM